MFVDASALVAITLQEPEGEALAARLEAASDPITSPMAIYEAVLAVARNRKGGQQAARIDIQILLTEARIRCVPIAPEDGDAALDAFERFGKGRGHPASLNMGDCFAYAVARRHRVPLLFKGDDFARTDVNAGLA
ncbi:type II toxin-antitoxin system VapC family toxin [Methylobacterium dankookense]|uniref:Ribonuclease VapC n=1 Tax=Methylobacterium dankookense TaxID=560405 RepID=A0A564FVZ9_9HYPH|nr:type II toxin-antitoxin system VapC family toxin [Methylobacterium dankookense]GJD58408.1 Ribonuclease VapC30 [Methylobacterium dankookense]VUF12192.1 Ribonuclease VapC30 [Methylobacterium dankookense]